MGGARGFYILRVIILNLLVLFIVLFLSTPAAIYSSLTMIKLFGLEVSILKPESLWGWGSLLGNLLPPLVIIIINSCLLYLLDFFASWEKRVSHSKYQQSTFLKAFIYLLLNMLLIPALTLST